MPPNQLPFAQETGWHILGAEKISMNYNADYFLELYNLEEYLFEIVSPKFQKENFLSAFDFFCIVIWKANRAKSKIALKLLNKNPCSVKNLDLLVRELTDSLAKAQSPQEKMRILIEDWKFGLPMASAILSVLWPNDFSIYDFRVREQLHKADVSNKKFKNLWKGYQDYLNDVKQQYPKVKSLRDKDRVLWAKSFKEQLDRNIKAMFSTDEKIDTESE